MKKLTNFLVILLSSVVLFSCSYDDSFLKEEIEKMKTDIKSLKEQTTSLKTVVDALNAGKVITNVKKLADDKGYKITFNDGAAIEVLNGEKAPVIGIQESENVYYWTITTNGKTEFLLDKNNHKLPVSGKEGKPGNTPELGIDAEGYWTVNNIRIKDGNGKDIKAEGDSFFKEVKENESEVTFVLADGKTIVIPKVGDTFLYFELPENVQMFVGKPGENLRLRIKFANIDAMEITTKPNQWRVNLHRPDKYVNVSIPKDAKFGVYEVVLRGLDKKGLVFMAVAKISIAAAQGFTDPMGAFILNEGNMTTENGSLIFISSSGHVFDKAYANINGQELGNVTQDLFIKDKKIWIISQNGTVAATGTVFKNEGMLVVANAETMKRVAVYDEVLKENGKYKLSWPTHLAVLNDENVFIRDNQGVSLFNSKTEELTLIPNTRGAAKNRMAVANNKVFVIKSRQLIVFEADKKEIVHTIDMGAAISGVITSKDGNLWVSTTGNPNKISKVDSKTFTILKENAITEGRVSNGFWSTPGITAKGDTLYYSGGSPVIYRHIFSTGESKKMIDTKTLVSNANMVYNGPGVHPITGDVYINTIKGFGWDFTINNISVFNFDEKLPSPLKANYEDYTRFPAGIFFSANFK
ncbi:hypothetical protein HMPREF1981_01436 [Bacteroides pyogenes F0041]|uniref:DUF4988 domain-containing protein n=1 Tax=Bacteroides pyogenes F0041 TaxID=1321819 RepID=U2DVR8_9BACE|nr:DUF5074 domain-containing protein [Bacteroides pyogenes]ERI85712.1 hypothetical protein HMPREF1981_01436 [Bacteroides pyogenes F0041]MBB3893799.1 hypothetical protein [Bacteroides pyogenes]SUV33751.1 surface layer protein [Bacteroides pyogenes]